MIGIYSRISSDIEGSTSVEYQEKRGIEFAKSKNLPYQLYSDRSISGGAAISERPAFSKLLNDIEEGNLTAIYISNSDRAARNESTWFILVDLILQNNIDLYESGQLLNLNDPSVTLLTGIKAVVNANFRRETAKSLRRRLLENAKEGKAHGIISPYGYDKDENKYLVINEEEVKVVKLIYKMFLEGKSINGIASHLTDSGVPTKFEKLGGTRTYKTPLTGHEIERDNTKSEWSRTVVRKILTRPLYKGVRKWKQGKGRLQQIHYLDVPHLSIVSTSDWEKVNDSYIKNKGAIKGKVNEHRYLLPPLLECNECGELFYGHLFDANRAYYKCRSYRKRKRTCKSKAQPLDPLNDFITTVVFSQLYDKVKEQMDNGDENRQEQYLKELNRIEAEIEKHGQSQKRVNNIYADGDYTKEEFRAQKERIVNKIADLQIQKSNTEQILSNLKAPKNLLKEMEVDIVNVLNEVEAYKDYDSKYDPIKSKFEQIIKGRLALKLPFKIKQDTIRKYVSKIGVVWNAKSKVSIIEITFNLPIENQKYLVDSSFLIAVNYENRNTAYVNVDRANYQTEKTNERKFKELTEIILNPKGC